MSRSAMSRPSAVDLLCPYVKLGHFKHTGNLGSLSSAAPGTFKLGTEEELDNVSDVDSTSPPLKPVSFSFPSGFPQNSNADGSLPNSPPDSPDTALDSCCFPKADPQLHRDTHALIGEFLRARAGLSRRERVQPRALPVLRRVVEELLEKHRLVYQGMIQKLDLARGDDTSYITTVAKNLFSDGYTNWGRVASLVAFGAVVCQQLKDSGREHCIDAVATQISNYLVTEQQNWLSSNKGWDGFVDFFHIEDTESLVRNALMAFAGVAGIGAGLALLIR
ncbi:hypothetical protein GN956_G16514 [Arapaima gigas]